MCARQTAAKSATQRSSVDHLYLHWPKRTVDSSDNELMRVKPNQKDPRLSTGRLAGKFLNVRFERTYLRGDGATQRFSTSVLKLQ